MSVLRGSATFSQEKIVLATAALMFVIFALTARGFIAPGNLVFLLKNVAVLGVLGIAMAVVVIGRGIDLAVVSTMVISTAFFLVLYNAGWNPFIAAACGLGFAIAVGLLQGFLIAFADVPSIFTTLAGGVAVYGFGQFFFVKQDVNYLPDSGVALRNLGALNILGIPTLVYFTAFVALLFFFVLRHTKIGRFVYALGDNPAAARLSGISVRMVAVSQYVLSSIIAFLAGLMTVAAVSSMSTRIINSAMIYDIILVVVIGGVGLSGGKGGVRNVIAGTVLVGILLNGMTLLDVPYASQSIVKGVILLIAIVIDSRLNPRDEQTEKQGDI